MKKLSECNGSITQFLNIGDEVDEEMVDYFINVLPPVTMNGNCVQMGEAYSHELDVRNGKYRPTYLTLKSNGQFKPERKWYYTGCCFKGEVSEPVKQQEKQCDFCLEFFTTDLLYIKDKNMYACNTCENEYAYAKGI